MATLARIHPLDWTVLAAGLSLMGVACSSSDSGTTGETGGASTSSGGSTLGAGGATTPGLGGMSSIGGALDSTGGAATGGAGTTGGLGGATSASGGQPGFGGAQNFGGQPTSGGATGLPPLSGGATAVGGQPSGGTAGVDEGVGGVGAAPPAGGATSTGGGTCTSEVATGDTCVPGVDVEACVQSSETCECQLSGQWSCTPTTGGAGGAGGTDGVGGSGATTGDVYNPDFVEFYGEDCDVAEPHDVNVSTLPDLFEFFSGSRMSKKSDWRCRRAELKKAVEKYIHGEKPGRPATVTGSVTSNRISVHVENGGNSADFNVSISLPAGGGGGPVPAIIVMGNMMSLDASLVAAEGVATISYDYTAMASETSRTGIFSSIYGSTGASAQVGWAWGVSRIIDVLVDERDAGRNDVIDPTAIGITGCSRLGKGAFTIGAFDERIALGIPQESGTGGVSAFRIVNTRPMGPNGQPAQSLDSAWSEAQGWFGTAFGNYKGNVNVIPADTHSLVAMYAPRGLLVLDNSRIGELGSIAQHAATAAGGEVFKALGVEMNVAYNGGNPSDPHNHCSFYAATQAEPLKRAIRAHLTRTAEPDGRMEPQPVATANLAEWILWDTPTLEDN